MPNKHKLSPLFNAAPFVIFCALIVSGCQTTDTEYSPVRYAEPVKYNLTLNIPNEALSTDVHRFLTTFDEFLDSLSSQDRDDYNKYIDDDFKIHIVYKDATSTSFSKAEFLDLDNHDDLKLLFFRSIMYTPIKFSEINTGEVLLTLYAEKSSENFRSTQTVLVIFSLDLLKIKSMVIQPLLPNAIETKPEIYLSRISSYDGAYARNWRELVSRLNPDGAVAYVKAREVLGVKRDESLHSVLAVFPESLPPGANVRIEHQFFLVDEKRWLGAYKFYYKIDQPGEYQVIESISRAGGPKKRTITYRVFVNDEKVAERTVPVI